MHSFISYHFPHHISREFQQAQIFKKFPNFSSLCIIISFNIFEVANYATNMQQEYETVKKDIQSGKGKYWGDFYFSNKAQ